CARERFGGTGVIIYSWVDFW
nr:immunoglobulin heavy chain junction region [Macaca mulatta]MOX60639.1 immunoglobulin heavy chain junction region [Macaca mulatta]MOX62340.1 immunoglobulin heavy chain junction region [Macaca mulatta]MOX64325.1 immunoglobulin heavy chain junction region [Macaca mulatta]MOX67441.1 immunoglobulin heavy chain junction region [Macaca mulatta]